ACSRLVTYGENGLVSEISWQGTNDFCFEITPDLGAIRKNKVVMEQKGWAFRTNSNHLNLDISG
ncbi:MAG: hypothetical protein OQJ89_04135, partial [Kangiellaceae bacterium]|nr:hypothetical protein [Kangiellaceae bacterium]